MKKAILLIILLFISISFFGCGNELIPPSGDTPIHDKVTADELNVLGVAAQKAFENQNTIKKQAKKFNENESISGNSYPFDCVEITKGIKYYVENLELKELTDLIGEGPYIIIVADFITYILEKGKYIPCISDTLITFISENNMFTCLEDGFSIIPGGEMHSFSSHKRITDSSVEKTDEENAFVLIISFYEFKASIVYSPRMTNPISYNSTDEFDTSNYEELENSFMYELLELESLPETK